MRAHLILFLLCHCLLFCLCEVNATEAIEHDVIIILPESTYQPDHETPFVAGNGSTGMPTSVLNPTENKTVIEPVRCESNEDCQGYHIDSELSNMVICDQFIRICIIGLVEEIATLEPMPSTKPKSTTTNKPDNTNDASVVPSGESITLATTPTTSETTTKATTPPQVVVIEDSEFHSIPVVVWVLFTIPFISIIILGIICGRRLKMQSENIQDNLLRTTINGVHVDQLLSQRDIVQTIAFSRPPPTYEKATGEIPPSYETVLKSLEEKRQSIFQCDSLMDEQGKEHNCDNRSLCNVCSTMSRTLVSNSNNRSSRASPIIYTISRNNFPV